MNTYYDINGTPIRTGMAVRISNAYFKSDNGLWLVVRSAGDPCWTGNDLCLYKLRRDGKLSATKYSTSFWPLSSVVSDRARTAAANEWNKAHAEIEVVEPKTYGYIMQHFCAEAEDSDCQADYIEHNWGETDSSRALRNKASFLRSVTESMPV